MQITDKDIQMFRERAKTELQSNGAVGRLAWDAVVNALCNEVEELRKDAVPGSSAAMHQALERILAIEGYGAPWIEAKCIAQKALEGAQCTPPIAQETAKIEQPGDIAAALNKAGNICLFVKENCGDEQTARYMSEAIAAINEAVASSSTPGNAAAMREALDNVGNAAAWVAENCNDQQTAKYMNDIIAIVQTALSATRSGASPAPPRNCDRFDDEHDAQLAFLNEVWLISVDRETMLERDKFENWTDKMKTRYGRWLFAQAEGENKQ